jgi:peptidoglycan/LPS O-acetylase OafA/YrhL
MVAFSGKESVVIELSVEIYFTLRLDSYFIHKSLLYLVYVNKNKGGMEYGVAAEIKKKEQLNVIYIVRALAILGVIFVHVTSIPIGEIVDKSSSMYFYFNFLNVFNKFGTPTFIFLSALVLFYSYYDRPLNRKLIARFYQRRFLYILTPYIIFSAFYYIIQIYYSFGETWEQFFQNASLTEFFQMVKRCSGFRFGPYGSLQASEM